MEIKIEIEKLREGKLFLAVPMYGGMCYGMFARSVADLSALCTAHNIPLYMYFMFNESLIPRARNYCVDEFLRSGAKHMMFIDADIGFNPQDVLALMALQANEPDKYNIIGGPYQKKTIAWEKIKAAVDKGVADENPGVLENYVGDFVFNPKGGAQSFRIDEPAEVMEIGTGFMMITRDTFEKFQEAYPQYMYKPDHVRSEHFDGSREILMAFQAEIDPEDKRYLSEDYWFTRKAQKIGLKTWLCPWMKLSHAGTYIFSGSLPDLASIGVAATADPVAMKKKKK